MENRDLNRGSWVFYLTKYTKPYKLYFSGIFLALIITSCSIISIGHGLKILIDKGFSANNPELLDQALIFLGVITLLLSGASFVRYYLVTKMSDLVISDIRKDVYNHLVKLPLSYFEENSSGKILAKMVADTAIIQNIMSISISMFVRNSLIIVGTFIMLFATSLKLSLIALFILPLVIVPILILGKKVRKLSQKTQEKVGELSSHIDETVSGIRTIQAFTDEEGQIRKFSSKVGEFIDASANRITNRSFLTSIAIGLAFSAVGVVLWFGGHDVLEGKITSGNLSAFIFYAVMLSGSIGAISEVFADVQRASGAFENIMNLVLYEPEIKEKPEAITLGHSEFSSFGFNRVSFFYPSRKETAALEDISFTVNKGEKVAIVGVSGSGKSTIMKLAMRFYDPLTGSIKINDTDIRDMEVKNLRSFFALVPQEPFIFSGSIIDNITLSRVAKFSDVVASAQKARAYDFIKKLPNGFETNIGDKGLRLSGGEKQRISIARAILMKPKILLLDEATNSLDAENEYLVQTALDDLISESTTIVIAHRLSTVIKSDKIIMMENGRIIGVGKHEELLRDNQRYRKLIDLQFNMKKLPDHWDENLNFILH